MALEGKPLPLAPVALPKRASPAPAHHATPRANRTRRTTNTATVTRHPRRPPTPATPLATRASADAPVVDRLVTYAGVLTALTLAPLGQG